MEAILSGTIGTITSHVTRRLFPPKIHPIIREYTTLNRKYPFVAKDASQLLSLQQDSCVRDVLLLLTHMAQEDEARRPCSQWKMARLSAQAEAALDHLLTSVETWKSEELFTQKQIAEDDTVPLIKQHLENVLHNHMMSMLQ